MSTPYKTSENQLPGLIFFPGARATAYLSAMRQTGTTPSVIIVMKNAHEGNWRQLPGVAEGARNYYRIDDTAHSFAEDTGTPLIETDATSINDASLLDILNGTGQHSWIFSGGGILKKKLFAAGHSFLHVHPGHLPHVRGSTCFYYSLLHDLSVSASAFYLTVKLDSGDPIAVTRFRINLRRPTPEYIDFVVDPYIRAHTLQTVIRNNLKPIPFSGEHTPPDTNRPFYVIHPLLRSKAIEKVAGAYDSTMPEGIFAI